MFQKVFECSSPFRVQVPTETGLISSQPLVLSQNRLVSQYHRKRSLLEDDDGQCCLKRVRFRPISPVSLSVDEFEVLSSGPISTEEQFGCSRAFMTDFQYEMEQFSFDITLEDFEVHLR
eukprot:c3172_g1_i1.p1 GENE.c3172_g1_i1~~c3172_g1_i1.p1  ORF type:complete len:119 (-),score=11.80 c3172_g1_i1:59-415(-)